MSTSRLIEGLLFDLTHLQSAPPPTQLQDLLESALLRAGELECGLSDHEHDHSIPAAASSNLSTRLTDLLADALLTPSLHRQLAAQAEQLCKQLSCPVTLEVSPPEGFCFYALHPLAYGELTLELGLKTDAVAVIGIRAIGTTLSAVVASTLRKNAQQSSGSVERITVRPTGHPYNRQTPLLGEELAFVRKYYEKDSTFLIVDEGPGLSGSSFLSVAEALTHEGIQSEKIKLLTSHEVKPESLVAPNAAERWRKFQAFAVNSKKYLPCAESDLVPYGDWRHHIFNDSKYDLSPYRNPQSWPAVWSSMSSHKCFYADPSVGSAKPKTILKFEGLGAFGVAVRNRATVVHSGGFGPAPAPAANGFTAYPMLEGQLLSAEDLTEGLLVLMAEYLAFRLAELRADANAINQSALENMARFNFAQITGDELEASFHLALRHPVVADARMMPYEWIKSEKGTIQKLDAAAHGDNHFFPGPTDIAWDLAGVITEWKLDSASADYFLRAYEKASGDAPRSRLPCYLLAYAAFQAAYAKMAAASLDHNDAEQPRLLRDYQRYREMLLQSSSASTQGAQFRSPRKIPANNKNRRLP